MPKYKITSPDGQAFEINSPDGATQEQVLSYAQSQFKQQAQPQPESGSVIGDFGRGFVQGSKDLGAGLVRGAGSIGATLLAPVDMAARGLGVQNEYIGRTDRRQAMDEALKEMGANPESMNYGAGKIGSEIAGAAGIGGALAGAVKAAPMASRVPSALVDALRTGGMSAGGQTGAKALASRVAGGAATGGAAAGLVNPEDADIGAAIGGALPVAGAALRGSGTLIKKAIGGTTGVGDEALTQALRAGREGGKTAQDFTSAMRGESSMDDVLVMAKQNLDAMGKQKQAAYRQGMAGITADKTVLNLKNVDKAMDDAIGMASYKGQVKNEKAASALSQIKGEIDNWKSLDPNEFHTPEGLDALKQKVGGILEEIPFEQKTARSAASKVYDSLRSEINAQAPEYSKVMKGYSEASETIKEIEKSLSLGQKASADTSMRKLQSLMRNNVNTNYGQRTKLADEMIQAGGQDFMPALAGQALNDYMPRGIQRAGVGTGGGALAMTGNVIPAAGLAAISSPRLMGEAFYGAGKASGAVNPKLIQALRTGAYKSSPVIAAQ